MTFVARPLSVLLAGGGSAGHVNPLLAIADCVKEREPSARITVLGTAEGLEARLVPQRGYRLEVLPKAPFPRRPNRDMVAFPRSIRAAIGRARNVIQETAADVVVGFGGYVSTPAYLAARAEHVPIVVHEQNARPGLANRLGSRMTPFVATTFDRTALPHAQWVGMPLRREISALDTAAVRSEAIDHFGLDAHRPTLLVFGGSLGAHRLNASFSAAAADVVTSGAQVLHLTGAGKDLVFDSGFSGGDDAARYVALAYTDRMDLAYAAADLAICRAGAGTVCELAAIGLPAIYIPLPIGNGEQRLNAVGVVNAGGGQMVDDREVSPGWVRDHVVPLLHNAEALAQMGTSAAEIGERHADHRIVDLVLAAARRP
ncbi:MAG: undecaprenyldiphospho-muramoylpentapeptide beta-N-acetylglucosaminyltransferase [Ornithinimicrobium sp.]